LGDFKVGAENADVGIAVDRYTVYLKIQAEDLRDCAMECVIVNRISTVQQRAVDIK
jgi:hypothetical protein